MTDPSGFPPPPVAAPVIGIVGGLGRMGRWFEAFLRGEGYEVLVADLATSLSPEDLAARCDVVILAVPMEAFGEVAARVGPRMREAAFLTDLCSLKAPQVAVMLEAARCEVAGTHPLFGPGETEAAGLRVALCPGRGEVWIRWWEGVFRRRGVQTVVLSAERHDRAMAWVQALNHFILVALGQAAAETTAAELCDIAALATPSFQRQVEILARLAQQDPALYAAIQGGNPHAAAVLDRFCGKAERLRALLAAGDMEGFGRCFRAAQALGARLAKGCGRIPGEG
ncbi:prephenate dehydrogenase/arogenate dehydrogenase family protein [Dissulfurirhabdus thermomarina]|uniref:Prephenate dehydrogenase/arogenate dehydrogenase family protein n=1 Tax=Dissulfurirhabdus thermomarina TaxID=1765737 RepID=A0A6N9TNH6_DISTH|nr:prephenate dehydrogenase/arogenate dehydrogenase family protein [Dissulfurirhabdus thermomarina]NDY42805.1 prephenate dehydrogenase/arogenate dehydrogenase family protein [Dissulfurirhabdus thermomarina]NMX24387.1 prephenate dehydrogenase/arogenate dehydrogenase family protein [Dissulfurirhabdus thermomarina]